MVPGSISVLSKLIGPRRYTDPEYLERIGAEIYGGAYRGAALLRQHSRHIQPPRGRGYFYQLMAAWGWTSLPGLGGLCQPTQRHGFSTDAVMSMLESVIRGNSSMAQFDHPEFGGSGQWMLGGMTMVSDMFNSSLKGQVHGLCSELSRLIANQPDLIRSDSFQSQSQGTQLQRNDGSAQQHRQSAGYGGASQQQNAAGPAAP
jgi:hypothetical protein